MKIFLNIQLFQKRPSPKQLSEYFMKPRKTKDFALVSQKVLSPSSLCNLLPAFYRRNARVRRVLGLRTSSCCHCCSCASVCVFLLIQDEKCHPRPGHGENSFLASSLFRVESRGPSREEILATEDGPLGNKTQCFGAGRHM